jgi:dTDP-4-dehydrorhamnose 3,5-epimerase
VQFVEKELKGVYEITLKPNRDERGFFMRTWDKDLFAEASLDLNWVQENHSYSTTKGTIRGMHFQFPPFGEAKMLRAAVGEVFECCVDLRKGSPTFGKWCGVTLSAEKANWILIPRGFGAGMCTLSDEAHVMYKADGAYSPGNEASIMWDDPDIGIEWPLDVEPTISARDAAAMSFAQFVSSHGGLDAG